MFVTVSSSHKGLDRVLGVIMCIYLKAFFYSLAFSFVFLIGLPLTCCDFQFHFMETNLILHMQITFNQEPGEGASFSQHRQSLAQHYKVRPFYSHASLGTGKPGYSVIA